METTPLPAIFISAVMRGSLMGPPYPTGEYDLVINWDPQDASFDPTGEPLKEGERSKRCHSWKEAYNSALVAVETIVDPVVQKVLRRGLTPIPLMFLRACAVVTPCGEADLVTAKYSWLFLSNRTGASDVIVDEVESVFQGIHDNR